MSKNLSEDHPEKRIASNSWRAGQLERRPSPVRAGGEHELFYAHWAQGSKSCNSGTWNVFTSALGSNWFEHYMTSGGDNSPFGDGSFPTGPNFSFDYETGILSFDGGRDPEDWVVLAIGKALWDDNDWERGDVIGVGLNWGFDNSFTGDRDVNLHMIGDYLTDSGEWITVCSSNLVAALNGANCVRVEVYQSSADAQAHDCGDVWLGVISMRRFGAGQFFDEDGNPFT